METAKCARERVLILRAQKPHLDDRNSKLAAKKSTGTAPKKRTVKPKSNPIRDMALAIAQASRSSM
jgi:hypothetical protein